MRTPWAWWTERCQIQREIQEDAISYYRLYADIQDLAVSCPDLFEIEAAALWLIRNDMIRRWKPGDDMPPPSQYWGPVETFRQQVMLRRKQNGR